MQRLYGEPRKQISAYPDGPGGDRPIPTPIRARVSRADPFIAVEDEFTSQELGY